MFKRFVTAVRIFLFENVLFGFILRRQYERFWHILGGHIFFQTLATSVEVGLFDLLYAKPSLTRSEIAHELHLKEKPVRILLLGLTSHGMLKKKEINTP